jgi:SAM-dependent methyltransferase
VRHEQSGSAEAMNAWLREGGATCLRSLGIRKGDRVLDFGCGPGGYAIPLAQIVGPSGRVIAIDKSAERLATLRGWLDDCPHREIVDVYETDGGLTLDWLEEESLDAALLFDVLQHVPDWNSLFASVHRALTPGGLLLINPSHLSHPGKVDVERMKSLLLRRGFSLEGTRRGRVMHYHFLHNEEIFIFRLRRSARGREQDRHSKLGSASMGNEP